MNGNPDYKAIEWVEIDPKRIDVTGRSINNQITDFTEPLIELLTQNNIPFSIEGGYIRIWGYIKPGQCVDFVLTNINQD